MMDDVGPLGAIEPDDRQDRAGSAEEPVAAPAPGERAQRKALGADPLGMRAHPRRDDDGKTGLARRPRHRQAVRVQKYQSSVDEKQQLRAAAAIARDKRRRRRDGKDRIGKAHSGNRDHGDRGDLGGLASGSAPLYCICAKIACTIGLPAWPAAGGLRHGGGGRGLARILVTGAAGFIGRALCLELARRGHAVLAACRGAAAPVAGAELRAVGDIGPRTDWSGHLAGVEIVVHLAARAHRPTRAPLSARPRSTAPRPWRGMRPPPGCARLVHISSIRAMGASTPPGAPFRAADPARPADPYGRAKLAIEAALAAAARGSGLELVILRPPLVHGPGVKGNLRALLGLVASGAPLPFAGIDNRRSLIFLDNLVDLTAGRLPASGRRARGGCCWRAIWPICRPRR